MSDVRSWFVEHSRVCSRVARTNPNTEPYRPVVDRTTYGFSLSAHAEVDLIRKRDESSQQQRSRGTDGQRRWRFIRTKRPFWSHAQRTSGDGQSVPWGRGRGGRGPSSGPRRKGPLRNIHSPLFFSPGKLKCASPNVEKDQNGNFPSLLLAVGARFAPHRFSPSRYRTYRFAMVRTYNRC